MRQTPTKSFQVICRPHICIWTQLFVVEFSKIKSANTSTKYDSTVPGRSKAVTYKLFCAVIGWRGIVKSPRSKTGPCDLTCSISGDSLQRLATPCNGLQRLATTRSHRPCDVLKPSRCKPLQGESLVWTGLNRPAGLQSKLFVFQLFFLWCFMMFQCCVGNVIDSLDVLRCFVNLIPIPLCLSKSVLLLQNLFAFVFFCKWIKVNRCAQSHQYAYRSHGLTLSKCVQ